VDTAVYDMFSLTAVGYTIYCCPWTGCSYAKWVIPYGGGIVDENLRSWCLRKLDIVSIDEAYCAQVIFSSTRCFHPYVRFVGAHVGLSRALRHEQVSMSVVLLTDDVLKVLLQSQQVVACKRRRIYVGSRTIVLRRVHNPFG
jgi:hypothetical protein